jgi:hypothetical protein
VVLLHIWGDSYPTYKAMYRWLQERLRNPAGLDVRVFEHPVVEEEVQRVVRELLA